MERLAALRERIGRLDCEIVAKAAERIALAREAGELKRQAQRPIVDYAQERAVLERARSAAADTGLDGAVAESVIAALVRASVTAQDLDSVRRASMGAGQTAVVVGGEGRMGRWFVRFLADQGYAAGALDTSATDEENAWARAALPAADLVICAAPPVATAEVYTEWATAPPSGVIADIASIKAPLLGPIRRLQAAGARVASLHPMFGPSVVLLRDCDVVVCDTGDAGAERVVEQLFATTTARIVHLSLHEHDRLMADALTLAHATVIAFALALPEQPSPLRSTTLGALKALSADVVRESPDVYFEIQAHNPNSPAALDRLSRAVARLSAAVAGRDLDLFRALMGEGQRRTAPVECP
jgi:chorismate mutase/prephenate dehydrogenase